MPVERAAASQVSPHPGAGHQSAQLVLRSAWACCPRAWCPSDLLSLAHSPSSAHLCLAAYHRCSKVLETVLLVLISFLTGLLPG